MLMKTLLISSLLFCNACGQHSASTITVQGTINLSVSIPQLNAFFLSQCCQQSLVTAGNVSPTSDQISSCVSSPTADVTTCSSNDTTQFLTFLEGNN